MRLHHTRFEPRCVAQVFFDAPLWNETRNLESGFSLSSKDGEAVHVEGPALPPVATSPLTKAIKGDPSQRTAGFSSPHDFIDGSLSAQNVTDTAHQMFIPETGATKSHLLTDAISLLLLRERESNVYLRVEGSLFSSSSSIRVVVPGVDLMAPFCHCHQKRNFSRNGSRNCSLSTRLCVMWPHAGECVCPFSLVFTS